MTEAWMKRGAERQEFLNRIKRVFYDELDETNQYGDAQVLLCMAFTEFFARQRNIGRPLYNGSLTQDNWLWTLLFDKVWPVVQAFARTPEEAMDLMADLFKWSSESVIGSVKGPLQTQEITEPEKVFGGRKSMDEVELNDSGGTTEDDIVKILDASLPDFVAGFDRAVELIKRRSRIGS